MFCNWIFFQAWSSGSRVLSSYMWSRKGQLSSWTLLHGTVTQQSRPSPSHSVHSQISELRRSASRGAHQCYFLVQPTSSSYISQQSSFGAFWGEAAGSSHCGSNGSLWWAHIAVGTVQPPTFLRQRWNPRDEGPLCSITSWWNKATLRFLILAGLKPEMMGVLPVWRQLTIPGEEIHLPGLTLW